jgi:hypothetical protein
MKTMAGRIQELKRRAAAGRDLAAGHRAAAQERGGEHKTRLQWEAALEEATSDGVDAAVTFLFPDDAPEELSLLDWYREIRSLLGELPSALPLDDVDITLVGRADFFGARCSSFAATGETPVMAMTRLRDKLREAVAKRAVVSDTEPAPPTVRTP